MQVFIFHQDHSLVEKQPHPLPQVDAALEDISVPTTNESDDQVVSIRVDEASNAVTQFVGDNIDLNIFSIHGNTSFHSMGWIKVTSPAPPLLDPQTTAAVHRVKLKALAKAKLLKQAEVKILPFMNMKKME